LPFLILFIQGPAGIGKSTLLRAFQEFCRESSIPSILLETRNLEPTPSAFLEMLRNQMQLPSVDEVVSLLGKQTLRNVLLIDDFEKLQPIQRWLADTFFPQLSAETLIVIADAAPLSLLWRTDPGWAPFLRTISLRNFSHQEAATYFCERGVPLVHLSTAFNFTYGHPLALSLFVDHLTQNAEGNVSVPPTPEAAPDMIQSLLDQFIAEIPSPTHRAALETAALLRTLTEPILEEILRPDRADSTPTTETLFRWLRGLSFFEASRHGIFPHDVTREALLADLRWRNRDRYQVLHDRARRYYMRYIEQPHPDIHQAMLDYIFLHRDNPVVRSAFNWQENTNLYSERMQPGDIPYLRAMVERYEGSEAARIADLWFKVQPENVVVFHDESKEPAGFVLTLALEKVTPSQRTADPAIGTMWNYLARHCPLRHGETASHFRFWMARDTYQAPSPIQSMAFLHMVRHYLTQSGLVFTHVPCADATFWSPVFQYAELSHLPELDFRVGGHQYGGFSQDWRQTPPLQWLTKLADKETTTGIYFTNESEKPERLIVLSEQEFHAAVHSALRHYTEPEELANNPLLRSRLITLFLKENNGKSTSGDVRINLLRTTLYDAASSLQNRPRRNRCYRPLMMTYLRPVGSQERAAEMLNLPYSTFRRHLAEGITEVTRLLWLQEVADDTTTKPLGSRDYPAINQKMSNN
jgi:hypothetical protein